MIRHFENPGIVRTVYLSIFRHIQGHLTIFSHVQANWETLRHIEALLRTIEPYSDIFRTLHNPCIYNRAILRTLAHLEPEASKPVKYVRWSYIFKVLTESQQFIQVFSRTLRDIQGYWCLFSHTHWHATREEWEASPALFKNRRKCPDFLKKGPDCVHLWVKFSIQNVV